MSGPTFDELDLLDSLDHEFTLHRLARYYVEQLGPWGAIETAWIRSFLVDDVDDDHVRQCILTSIRRTQKHMKARDLIRSEFMMDLFRQNRKLDGDEAFRMFECASQAGLPDSIAALPFHEWLVSRPQKPDLGR